MKTRIVRIGKSQGIVIPRSMLLQAGLESEVEICAEHETLVIRATRKRRLGWAKAFREMARRGDDTLLDDAAPSLTTWDKEEWEWR